MCFRSIDFELLEDFILNDFVLMFATQNMAKDAAISLGINKNSVIKIERRFEFVWIIAEHSVDVISKHIVFDELKVYLKRKGAGGNIFTIVRGDQSKTRKDNC